MKKHGFTLSETIIALGVIGIIAAITAPLLNNIIPDKDKITVLKNYKIISDIHNEIKQDPQLWRNTAQDKGGWVFLAGNNRYYDVVLEQLQTTEDSKNDIERGIEFDTIDGNHWEVEEADSDYATIIIDLMNPKKQRCTYDVNSCQKPGQFRFLIDANTLNIQPGDPLTAAFLANANKLNDKKADYQTAKNNAQNDYSKYIR